MTDADSPGLLSVGGCLPVVEDAVLVTRSQQGERAAFEQLVHRTARLLFARLYLDTGDSHAAEDLVQETYLVAWRSIGQVTDPRGFRQWLFSIARTVRVDHGRRQGRKKRAGSREVKTIGGDDDPFDHVVDPSPSPAEAVEIAEERRRVLGLLRSLPAEYREPLMFRYIAGADYETIGRQLALSNGSLRGLLNRGMTRLREMMKEQNRSSRSTEI